MAGVKRTKPNWMKRTTTKRVRNNILSNQNKGTVVRTSVAARSKTLSPSYFKTHLGGFPQRMTQTLRYATLSNGSLLGGVYTEPTVIVLNGIYDPDAALGGGQPAGYAKLMAVYTKCFVRAAKMTVQITNTTNGNLLPIQVGITLSTFSTAMTYATAAQYGMVTQKVVGINPDNVYLNQSVDCNKFFAVDDLLDNTAYNCTVSANPAQIVCGHLWMYGNYSGVSTASFAYTLTVDFDCIFTDPQPFT